MLCKNNGRHEVQEDGDSKIKILRDSQKIVKVSSYNDGAVRNDCSIFIFSKRKSIRQFIALQLKLTPLRSSVPCTV
jgi:uncharacterized protein YjhX (UPF0386 family)